MAGAVSMGYARFYVSRCAVSGAKAVSVPAAFLGLKPFLDFKI